MSQLQTVLISLMTFLRQNAEWVIISLVLGFVIWIVAVLDDDPVQQRTLPQGIRVEFIQGEDVVRGSNLTRTARVTLLAPRSTFEKITSDDILLTADLSPLNPGTHIVEIEAEIVNEELRGRVVEIEPSELSVEVVAVSERLIQITPLIASPTTRGTANCEPNEVRVRGPSPAISTITRANVVIDVTDQSTILSDDYSVSLFPDPITDIEVVPETVTCTVEVERREDTVTVDVVADVTGDPPEGYLLNPDYEVEPAEVEVTGDPEALAALGGEIKTEEINVIDQTENFSRVVGVELPDGIELVQSTQRITVTISISEPNTTINFEDVEIQILNLEFGLDVEVSPENVNVSITGPPSRLEDVKKEDLSITVDMAGLGVGTYQDLSLEADWLRPSLQDALIPVVIQPETVDVTISERVIPTSTPLGIIG
jgi:YbbR domain-containing protein